jgi:hypothetical protein
MTFRRQKRTPWTEEDKLKLLILKDEHPDLTWDEFLEVSHSVRAQGARRAPSFPPSDEQDTDQELY